MNQQPPKPQDPMIRFRAIKRGKNSKGGDRTELYLTQEEAKFMIDTLSACKDNDKGVKLDIHISERTSQDGRKFDGGCCFIKPVQEFGARRPVGQAPETQSKVEKVRQQLQT